jgi:type I restriction enzyme, R subunit
MAQFPSFLEDHISQLPALQLLQSLGYVYLRPEEVILERRGNRANVLLEGILEKQLRRLNRISFKGQVHEFSDRNIQIAIQTLQDIPIDGLVHSNEKAYDLLSLGKNLEQTIGGDTRSFTLNYIDWANPENNQFHVVEEFEVERTGSHQICRPDIVLFVNGIPFVVIECKRPDGPDAKDSLKTAISRQLRNQNNAYIPRLFLYSQILLVANNNEAKYGTAGTRKEFWTKWKEDNTNELGRLINKPLSSEQKDRLFAGRFAYLREFFDELELEERLANQQDRAIYSLCRPARLIELTRQFVLYDAGEKKIARYHQYFAIKNALTSIKRVGAGGSRMGGVIWQTQGSGKSLAMVMLAKAIALDDTIIDPRIVLVSDRIDLGEQIWGTFRSCGKEPVQARTGRQLLELLTRKRDTIITTLRDKFETALKSQGEKNLTGDIFVLADEKHRGQLGDVNVRLQKALSNACYISFTGAPLKKKDKATAAKFGGFIVSYPVSQAIEDEVVVPLLSERRQILQDTDRRIYLTALDISEHFSKNWQGTPIKAQLLADSKLSALAFKKWLDDIGKVSSEVLLADPDTREGDDAFDVREAEVGEEEVRAFWKRMMEKYGGEQEYYRSLINGFNIRERPEIIIVVDKLLTGFEAPRNTVLYLARGLKGHPLLEAIARVNRLREGKDFGYVIDYYGVLGDNPFSEFDHADLQGMLTDIGEEAAKLPERRAELWDHFKEIKNDRDGEAFERLLVDQEKREDFYDRLSAFSRTMSIAFSSLKFMEETGEESLASYKRDMAYFQGLRQSVRRRYADGIADDIDDSIEDARVQKLIDIARKKPLVSIFEREKFRAEIDQLLSEAAKADTIAHRTKKAIAEKMEEDQIFYRRFSRSMDDAIKKWREGGISDTEYLNKVTEIMNSVRDRTGGDIPVELLQNELASTFYGIVDEVFGRWKDAFPNPKLVSVNAALKIERIIQENIVVDWIANQDVQNQIKNLIEDYLYSVKQIHDIDLRPEDMDRILDRSIEIAKSRYSQ